MDNDFLGWMTIKDGLDRNGTIVNFSEGQIWWAALGKNVGVEINGKNKDYSRPVVVFKKLSRLCFLAIPLTSQPHEGTWYAEFVFRSKHQYAVLPQIRMMSVSRLYNRIGKLSDNDFGKIRKGFDALIR